MQKKPGSSPRVWGQELRNLYDTSELGIIPTRVGTSQRIDLSAEQEQDHPHACGDKDFLESSKELERGSSPRVWGQDIQRKR